MTTTLQKFEVQQTWTVGGKSFASPEDAINHAEDLRRIEGAKAALAAVKEVRDSRSSMPSLRSISPAELVDLLILHSDAFEKAIAILKGITQTEAA